MIYYALLGFVGLLALTLALIYLSRVKDGTKTIDGYKTTKAMSKKYRRTMK